jgi:hypothetical protein
MRINRVFNSIWKTRSVTWWLHNLKNTHHVRHANCQTLTTSVEEIWTIVLIVIPNSVRDTQRVNSISLGSHCRKRPFLVLSSLDDDVYLYQNKKGRKSKLWWVEKPIKLLYKVCLLWINKERGKEKTLNRLIYEYRCESRLKTKNEESTHLVDTGLVVELEHLKTKTRLLDKKFSSVRGECDI